MSQDVSTKTIESQQAEIPVNSIGTPEWSVDNCADRLMDDLFEDVDRILSGGSRAPKPAAPDKVSLRSVQVPQIVLPPMMVPQSAREEGQIVEAKATSTSQKPKKSGKSFDRWLLGSACGLLLVTLGLWLWNRGYLQQFALQFQPAPEAETVAAPKTPEQLQAEADAEFINYMERSLEIMDRNAAGEPTASVPVPNSALPIPAPPPPVNVTVNPNLTVPTPNVTVNTPHQGNLAEVLNRIAIALERGINPTLVQPNLTVQIPRNPAPPPQTATAPTPPTPKPAPAPAPAPAPSPAPSPAPTVAASPKPSPAPSPAAEEAPKPEESPALSPAAETPKPVGRPTALSPQVASSAPAPSPQPAASATAREQSPAQAEQSSEPEPKPTPAESTTPTPTPTPATSQVSHELVGILELGDRSAALFEVDGVTRRVNIGERIGSSGWSLVEVKDAEAIVRRNGEVRSIFTGQSL